MNKKNILIAVLTSATLLGFMGSAIPTCKVKDCVMHQANAVNAPAEQPTTKYTDAPQITAKAGFLLEANSGEVLYEYNADKRLPIASMTKVATLGIIYDHLEKGTIKMDDKILVSDNAASMGGSQAFLDAGSEYTVHDLIQSIVVASANDSCVALAEKLYGTVEKFVDEMNAFAKGLGCTNTNFVNCTGLPATGAYSCARDMSKIYAHIMQSPHYGDFNKVWMYDLTHPSGRITGLTNTNKLVRAYDGCLGGKTGFTTEAGHCITVSAKRGDLKPIAVIIGASDSKTRFAESSKLMNYAFNGFENKLIVDKTVPIKTTKVKGSVMESAEIFPSENFYKLSKRGAESNITLASEIPDAITAPIKTTDSVGKIYVMENNKVIKEIAVQPNTEIKQANYFETIKKLVRKSSL